jgi:protein-L-isoaspartate O-methyltransferase
MGSGWQTALLQNLVGKEGDVYAIERIAGLVELARERFERLAISDIHIIHGDGMNPDDVPRGPFDMITCAAGSPDAPDFWKQRLSEKGGRMVYPKEVAAIKEGQTHWSDGHTEQAPEGWDDGPIHALCKTIRTGPDTFLEEFAAGHCRYVPLLPQTE